MVAALEARLVVMGYHLALADTTYDSLTAHIRPQLPATGRFDGHRIADLTTQQRLASTSAPRSSCAL
jgi:hypothetical protein